MSNLKRFVLNFSTHCDTDPHTKVNTVYVRGDVFDSKLDLDREFNTDPAKPKFTRVDNKKKLRYAGVEGYEPTTPVPSVPPVETKENEGEGKEENNSTYSTMTIEELRKFAESEGIALGKAKSKAEIITVIEAADGE